MSKQSYAKSKGRRGNPPFVKLENKMLESHNYCALSPRAVKLLVDVTSTYRGSNNGDLCITLKTMKKRGWNSNDQLRKGIAELIHYGFLIMTRQGGRNQCSLYAITWRNIDHCDGKHDLRETKEAFDTWKIKQPKPPEFVKSLVRDAAQVEPRHGLVSNGKIVSLSAARYSHG